VQTEEWRSQCQELQEVIQGASRKLAVGETRAVPNKFRHLTYSAVERQFNHALGKQLQKCSLLFCMGVRLRRENGHASQDIRHVTATVVWRHRESQKTHITWSLYTVLWRHRTSVVQQRSMRRHEENTSIVLLLGACLGTCLTSGVLRRVSRSIKEEKHETGK
jgi:hypothetical protein